MECHEKGNNIINGNPVPEPISSQSIKEPGFSTRKPEILPDGQNIDLRNERGNTEMKILSALFYAVASSLITVINKIVLTSYGFPSYLFLTLGQICSTIIILQVAKFFGLASFRPLEKDSFTKIFPLPLLFLGNAVLGLGATKEVSLPMFAALRRFSILMTMFAEFYVLGTKPTLSIEIAVYTMVGGSLLASLNDLNFNLRGYGLMIFANIITAVNGVCIKKKLNAKEYGKYGLIYYNAVFMSVPLFILSYLTGDIEKALNFEKWMDPTFLFCFLLSCVMGFILNASIVLCTFYNSALATSIVGCLKNVTVTYFGMFIGGDYAYDFVNFIGINISVFGSFFYTYVTFKPNSYDKSQSNLKQKEQ